MRCSAQAPQILRIGLQPVAILAPKFLADTFHEPRFAAGRTTDKRNELIVHEQLSRTEPLAPAFIDMTTDRIGKFSFKLNGHAATDDVVIQYEPRIEGRTQYDLACRGMRVQRFTVLCLEQ